MSAKSIEQFFTGKSLVVPDYQRDYAWKEGNVDDLFDDVEEALQAGGGHYLGTFILSQTKKASSLLVVDGQQRLTTLTMLLDALIDLVADTTIKQHYYNTFISHPVTGAKFSVLGDNDTFFHELLAENNPEPESDGQYRLRAAYSRIRLRVHALVAQGGQDLIKQWLLCVSQMEVLEFIEPDEGKAIRMFQSVNDRGVPLAKMDIVKSLLVYYSNRYLDGAMDNYISSKFGNAFKSFSKAKRLANEDGYKVRLVGRDSFREDDVLRYHYFAFDASPFGVTAGADYTATAETVLAIFLKPALQSLRNDRSRLQGFINAYVDDLVAFFSGLEALLQSTRTDLSTYLLFVVQDLSAILYPLVIRLYLMGLLSRSGARSDSRCVQDVIEAVDLRVFKLRGTNPQVDIYRITQQLPKLSIDDVVSQLQQFCQKFMPDAMLSSRLVTEDVYRNLGLPRMLLAEEEEVRTTEKAPQLNIHQLPLLNRTGLTVEHIFPQEPGFNVRAYGFKNITEYEQENHRIGNLVLLEAPLNSRCNNRTVADKMSAPDLYLSSGLDAVKKLSADHAGSAQGFQKHDADARSDLLAKLVVKRWPIVG